MQALTPEQIAQGRALVAALPGAQFYAREVYEGDPDYSSQALWAIEAKPGVNDPGIEVLGDDGYYLTGPAARLLEYAANNAPALLDAADELARIFTCTDCGAMFHKTLPDALYEDVTRCTRCVELEVTRAELARYKALLDDIIPVVNRSYPQDYLTMGCLRELLRKHGLEVE